jgi:hypothetical protein
MELKTHQLFAQLCETFLPEASSSMGMVASLPGGQQVTQFLHTKYGLAHDQSYKPVPKISWSDLKGRYERKWVLIKGSKGTGAIRVKNDNYEAVASAGGEVQVSSSGRGGTVLDFLKANIGSLKEFYVGEDTGEVGKKQKSRRDAQQSTAAAGGAVTQDTLIKKFRPLWARAITASIADIKGMVGTMVKNDAFEKAEKKIVSLKKLEQARYSIENGDDDIPSNITTAVSVAIMMAASHYYPEKTGEITKQRYGSSGYSSENQEGPRQLLADISAGDTKKLGTILSFFKRSLISG